MGKGRPEPAKRSKDGRYDKEGGCFIATAAYGDYDAPEVLELRKFRDEKLLPYSIGKLLVRTYYIISPSIARWLLTHPKQALKTKKALDQIVKCINK